MPPRAQRQVPLYQQVADDLTRQILDGRLVPGQRIPSFRDLVAEWGVSQQTVQTAVDLLRSARLVETSNQGTVVAPLRNAIGPEQMMSSARYPDGQRIEVTGAEMVEAPAYVRPILDLPELETRVIRREWRTFDSTGPYMLTVAWVPPRYDATVPELLRPEPLPDPRGEAHLVAERSGLAVGWGEYAHEARRVLDDGREASALELALDGHVMAETWKWGSGEQVLAYTERITRENRVVVLSLAP